MKKTIMVTGGTRGLGKAISEEFAQNGYSLVLVYLKNNKKAEETKKYLAKKFGSKIHIYQADLSSKESCKNVFRKIIKEVKEIEVLVNNAGFYRPNPSRQEKSLMKNTKLVGYQLLSEIGIKSGVKSIVNISSMFAGSNISKTAKVQREIELITIRLAKKYLGKARINCVRPGLNSGGTFLEVHSKQEIKKYLKLMPDNKMVSVHEIAKTVKFIAENKSITGQIISVDKGASLILS